MKKHVVTGPIQRLSQCHPTITKISAVSGTSFWLAPALWPYRMLRGGTRGPVGLTPFVFVFLRSDRARGVQFRSLCASAVNSRRRRHGVFQSSVRPSVNIYVTWRSLFTEWRDFNETCQLPQISTMWVGIAEKVFRVRGQGQRSRSYVCRYVNVRTAEAYISTMWRLAHLFNLAMLSNLSATLNVLDLLRAFWHWRLSPSERGIHNIVGWKEGINSNCLWGPFSHEVSEMTKYRYTRYTFWKAALKLVQTANTGNLKFEHSKCKMHFNAWKVEQT